MATMYGQAWIRQYGPEPHGIASDTWADHLAGLSIDQIREGFEGAKALGRDYPPSAPRFRALSLGIPSIHEVRRGLARRDAPFVRLVWGYLDPYAFAHALPERADGMLQGAYDSAREHLMRGGAYPPEPAGEIAHEKPKLVRAPLTTINKGMRDIAALLGEPDPPEIMD